MASTAHKMLVENDLDNLRKLHQVLHTTLDEKINEMAADVKNWLSQDVNTENRQPYEGVKQVTESAIAFVTDICQQIEDGWVKNVTEKMSIESLTRRSKETSEASAELGDITSLTAQVRAVEEKMTSLSQIVERLTSRQDLTESSVDKFSQLEDDVKVKSDHIKNTIQEMTTDIGRVQTDIGRMRTCIQHLEHRDSEMKRNIEMVTETMQNHSLELAALGKQSVSSDVAFTAFVPPGYKPVEGRTVIGYEKVRGNKDLSFSKDTGIFTAPIKGLYGVCVKQWQWGFGVIGMKVIKNRQSCAAAATPQDKNEEMICWTGTRGDGQGDFSLIVTEMEVDDRLRVVPNYVTERPSLVDSSSFSVFLINSLHSPSYPLCQS